MAKDKGILDIFSDDPKGIFGEEGLFADLFRTTKTEKRFETQTMGGRTLKSYRSSSDERGMVLEVDLPGVAPNDVVLFAEGNQLTVKGNRPGASGDNKFTSKFTIHEDYDVQTAKAKLAHGLLTVRLSRATNRSSRQIPIEVT